MNHRYLQIMITCLIVGTITFGLRENKPHCPSCASLKTTAPSINTALESEMQPVSTDVARKTGNSITIEPDITSKNLAYKHGFFSYSPTSILLMVNNEELEVNNYDPFTVKVDSSNIVTTRCKYTFIANHKGEIVATWKVKPGQKYIVTFNWKVPEKIQLDGAELISTRKLTAEESREAARAESQPAEETNETTEEVATAPKTLAPTTSKTAATNATTLKEPTKSS